MLSVLRYAFGIDLPEPGTRGSSDPSRALGSPAPPTVNSSSSSGPAHLTLEGLTLQTIGELVAFHGIDPTFFLVDSLTLEAGTYREALDHHFRFAPKAERWAIDRDIRRRTDTKGWTLNGCALDGDGRPRSGLLFCGRRTHPSARGPHVLRFDSTGTGARGGIAPIFFPRLSPAGALALLGDHGYSLPEGPWDPSDAHAWVRENGRAAGVRVFVEESALKSMAAVSGGQYAIGLNGINGGFASKTNTLRKGLQLLAQGGAVMVVRFDHPGSERSRSEVEARRLAAALTKAGAHGTYFTWPAAPAQKTDDAAAWLIRNQSHQDAPMVRLAFSRSAEVPPIEIGPRLTRSADVLIGREFDPLDVVAGLAQSRLVGLVGGMGTAKTNAVVGSLAALDGIADQKVVALAPYHRASLAMKIGGELQVPCLSDVIGSAEREGLYEGGSRPGVACCWESAVKVETMPGGEMTLEKWSHRLKENPKLRGVLFLDEVDQSLFAALVGGTEILQRKRSPVIATLLRLLSLPNVWLVAASANLGDVDLTALEVLSGERMTLIRSTYQRPGRSVDVVAATRGAGAMAAAVAAIKGRHTAGDRLWVGAGKCSDLDRLEIAADVPGVIRIDGPARDADAKAGGGHVSRFLADANAEAARYSTVLHSPALTSGLSVTAESFHSYVLQGYALGPVDAVQQIGRVRNALTRTMIVPDSAPDARVPHCQGLTPAEVRRQIQTAADGHHDEWAAAIRRTSPAMFEAVVSYVTRQNREAIRNRETVLAVLLSEGFTVREVAPDGLSLQRSTGARKATPIGEEIADDRAIRLALLRLLVVGEIDPGQAAKVGERLTADGFAVDQLRFSVAAEWEVFCRIQYVDAARVALAGDGVVSWQWAQVLGDNLEAMEKADRVLLARLLRVRADTLPSIERPATSKTVNALFGQLGLSVESVQRQATTDQGRIRARLALLSCPDPDEAEEAVRAAL